MNYSDEDFLEQFGRLLERLRQDGGIPSGSHFHFVYVAPGAQHVETQIITSPCPPAKGGGNFKGEENLKKGKEESFKGDTAEHIRQCIALLMQEKCGNEPLFNQQSHWQAVYRILVDKGYCSESDFDGFDTFIRKVMPEEVNKPYLKGSVKQISQTDFVRPFNEWRYDALTSKTRRPYDRMFAVTKRFLEVLEENGL